MSEDQPIMDDEFDLFELVEILWSERLILGCFLAVALAVGGLLISLNKKTYETVIKFEVVTLPPSVSETEVVADLQRGFHSKNTFSRWSETMPNAKLQLEDVVPTVLINEVVFASDADEAAVVSIQGHKILISSNDTGLVLDTLDYAQFVADLSSKRYAKKVQDEHDHLLALSDQLFESLERGSLPATFDRLPGLERFMALDYYLNRVRDGAKLLHLRLPFKPVATHIPNKVLLAASMMIGSVLGVLFVLIRRAYRQRKSMRARLVS